MTHAEEIEEALLGKVTPLLMLGIAYCGAEDLPTIVQAIKEGSERAYKVLEFKALAREKEAREPFRKKISKGTGQ